MNKTAIHNIAIAILTLPVFILSVFKPIVKVFSKLQNILFPMEENGIQNLSSQRNNLNIKIEVGGGGIIFLSVITSE